MSSSHDPQKREAFLKDESSTEAKADHDGSDHPEPLLAETLPHTPDTRPSVEITEPVPAQIGRYQVRGVLGRGGFGTVYLAHDDQLQRDVAIKVWRADRIQSEDTAAQLLKEAQTVARLERQASVVGVYDTGRQEDGSCFVVLEYIDGCSLQHTLKTEKLPPDRVLQIMIQTTAAIQHAHANGLVHRDLKPANILLDTSGNAHVGDFGLAIHETEQRGREGEIAGTPAYMAPEQVCGEADWLDGRADIWALGVVLYEMLAGRRPFVGEDRDELFDEIRHRDPKPPRQLDAETPESLERICLKCLAKSPTDRYTSAADLASDLRDVELQPTPKKSWVLPIVSVVAILLVIVAALLMRPEDKTTEPIISVTPGSGLQIQLISTLSGHTGEVWSTAFSPDDTTLASAGIDKIIKLWDVATGTELRQSPNHPSELRSVAFTPDAETLAAADCNGVVHLWEVEAFGSHQELAGHEGELRSISFSPDGTTLCSAGLDKTVRFWDLESAEERSQLAPQPSTVQSVAYSPDGQIIATAGDDRVIRFFDAITSELKQTLVGHTDGVCQVAFSHDGQMLASASWDQTVKLWDVETGELLRTITGHEGAVRAVAFSTQAGLLVSGGDDRAIRLWNVSTGQELATLRGHSGPITSVSLTSDGRG